MKTWITLGICISTAILLLTAYSVVFQADSSSAFPNSIFKSAQIDTFGKWGLIIFSAMALCFFILGYPRSKK